MIVALPKTSIESARIEKWRTNESTRLAAGAASTKAASVTADALAVNDSVASASAAAAADSAADRCRQWFAARISHG